MSNSILICDDSSFARKILSLSLPSDWDVVVTFAQNGQEAISAIEAGLGGITFLDLNMPIQDGYETMKIVAERNLNTKVIIVSADVQKEAKTKLARLGALDFIEKPVNRDTLASVLRKHAIYSSNLASTPVPLNVVKKQNPDEISNTEKLDAFRELTNLALGKAGERLADTLGKFIELPVPSIAIVHTNELAFTLDSIRSENQVSALSKGFVSMELSGEAFIFFDDANIDAFRRLLGRQYDVGTVDELEVLMDISNIMIGAILGTIAEQLSISFVHNSPTILGVHDDLSEIIKSSITRWDKVLVVEIDYKVSDEETTNFELLLVIPNTELDIVFDRITNVGNVELF